MEAAIWIWFTHGDPVAVHTLAVAAHDCFDALIGDKTREPSTLGAWLKKESRGRQKRVREAQNFFKHGRVDMKGTVQLNTIDAEAFMMDCVTCYEILFEKPTPLMRLYSTRFLYEHPNLITEDARPIFAKNAEVHRLANSTRKEFFERVFPVFLERYSSGA